MIHIEPKRQDMATFLRFSWAKRHRYLKYLICLSVTWNIKNIWKAVTITIDRFPLLHPHPFPPDTPLKFHPWDDVWGSILGSPVSTIIEFGNCKCYLNSMDCLDFLECIPSDVNQKKLMNEGALIRRVIKENTTTFAGPPVSEEFLDNETVSFGIQATTISLWRRWLMKTALPMGMANRTVAFMNESMYSTCREKNLLGWMCLLRDFQVEENTNDEEDLIPDEQSINSLKNRMEQFRNNLTHSTTLEYLQLFSHVSRIAFNLRPHVLEIYKRRLKTIDHNRLSNDKILRVALHVRRGDACRFMTRPYHFESSYFEDAAQIGNKRLCYSNFAYMESLLRIMKMIDRHIVVYLATDYASSFLDEISSDSHLRFIYLNASWKYLDYPRKIFDYASTKRGKKGMHITDPRNTEKAILGEAAFVDIWHLSHGQAFVGHLGSRFGKVSWIQAIGRHNAFVPFFSVDGHSICCELGESCESISRFVVSLENCLAIFWPLSKYSEGTDENQDSPFRVKAAEAEVFHRIEIGNYSEFEEPYDFVGSPASKVVDIEGCKCDIASVDCLHMIPCMKKEFHRSAHAGIMFREVVRQFSQHEDAMEYQFPNAPMGMGSQHVTIAVWKQWLSENSLPIKVTSDPDRFVNESNYPHCVKMSLQGRECFLNDITSTEILDAFDLEIMNKYKEYYDVDKAAALQLIRRLQANRFNVSTLDYLLGFSQISRMAFSLRAHMLEIYDKYLETVGRKIGNSDTDTFSVSMHLRRGDACMHETTGYEKQASTLNSPAQSGSYRLCYDTQVYMEALQRILNFLPDKNVIVYISTDHLGAIMDEIKSRFSTLYKSVTWKYLKYPRQYFNYNNAVFDGGNYIENPENRYAANLGETAVEDIWHLSHGQVFIGHLGSRFGKIAWWQATARYHSFIPYFSVDGHSTCCDIDELCGLMAKYVVSMENCLAIFWPDTKYVNRFDEDGYFSLGSHFRKGAAIDEIKFRSARNSTFDNGGDDKQN